MNPIDVALIAVAVSVISVVVSIAGVVYFARKLDSQISSEIETLGYISALAIRVTKLEKVPAPSTDKPVAKVRAGVQKPVKKGIKNV